jgi:hypothetical protein
MFISHVDFLTCGMLVPDLYFYALLGYIFLSDLYEFLKEYFWNIFFSFICLHMLQNFLPLCN